MEICSCGNFFSVEDHKIFARQTPISVSSIRSSDLSSFYYRNQQHISKIFYVSTFLCSVHIYKLGPSYNGSFQRCPITPLHDNSQHQTGSGGLSSSSSPVVGPAVSVMGGVSTSSTSPGISGGASVGGVLAAVNEEKIIWAINARSVSTMNVIKMKKIYGKQIAITISKMVGTDLFLYLLVFVV